MMITCICYLSRRLVNHKIVEAFVWAKQQKFQQMELLLGDKSLLLLEQAPCVESLQLNWLFFTTESTSMWAYLLVVI